MDWQDLKNKGAEELKKLLTEKRRELLNLRFQAHGRQLKQVKKISLARKEIARMLMLLNNKIKR